MMQKNIARSPGCLEQILEDENAFKGSSARKRPIICHEIKNPFTALIGYSKLMAEQKVEPDTFPENSNIIHKAALRMLNLCESMVEHSERADVNEDSIPEDQIQDVNSIEILEEVKALFGEMAAERDINLVSNVAKDFSILQPFETNISPMATKARAWDCHR